MILNSVYSYRGIHIIEKSAKIFYTENILSINFSIL